MPYYLVTQTSLVEGVDEVEAARKVLRKLRLDCAVDFTVKYDEQTIVQVRVANVSASEAMHPTVLDAGPPSEPIQEDPVLDDTVVDQASSGFFEWRGLSVRRIMLGSSLFTAGVTVGLVINGFY